VESDDSIRKRRGQSALNQDQRLGAIARLEAVDRVVLLNPQGEELENLNDFYEKIWQTLGFQFYFFGNRTDNLADVFMGRGQRLGIFTLWARLERTGPSTTELLNQLLHSCNPPTGGAVPANAGVEQRRRTEAPHFSAGKTSLQEV
jgi:RNAse (barnase) inhibitor barstar